jgi:outer membrane protein insertion porin family
MPAFGLLGIDYGYGFDGLPQGNGTLGSTPNGWKMQFIIGQQF